VEFLRAETVPLNGNAWRWDPSAPAKFVKLAGRRFLRQQGDTAIVTAGDGSEVTVYPGWLVILPDGAEDGDAHFAAPKSAWTVVSRST
jgi:hypothetical protein